MKLQHLMYRNQGTDWLNVCSVQCQLCKLDHALLSLRTLWANLRAVGVAQRCFDLGSYSGMYDADSWHRPMPWKPGHGLSADHECIDCGAPMLTVDVSMGLRTCDNCARDRRDSR